MIITPVYFSNIPRKAPIQEYNKDNSEITFENGVVMIRPRRTR